MRMSGDCCTKKVIEIRVGDEVVQRDGAILTVTSVRHTANRVVLGLKSFMGRLNDLEISKRKEVYVPVKQHG